MSKPKKHHPAQNAAPNPTNPTGEKETGAFASLAVTRPDARAPDTRVALPSDDSVAAAREWVEENKK